MQRKNLSVFVETFVPDFINRESPELVTFLTKYVEYLERYNEVKQATILQLLGPDYDPEQNGTFYQGIYIDLDYADLSESLILSLKGSLVKGVLSNAIYKVDDVVFSIADNKYILKARPSTTKTLILGEDISEVDIGEYTQISNLLLYRDIDESIDEFISLHASEYLSGLPANLSSDIKILIKNIRSYYKSKGTEQSFKFLFRAIWDSEVDFYFPKVDILRASDGKWFQPYLITLQDSTNINDFETKTLVGQTSGTRADVEKVLIDFANAVTVPEFFNWTDIVGLTEQNNGFAKTPNITGWNAAARTVETGYENFGVEFQIIDNFDSISFSLMDDTVPTGTDFFTTNSFTITILGSGISAWYGGNPENNSIDNVVNGDIVRLEQSGDKVRVYKNNVEIYEFVNTPPPTLAVRVALNNILLGEVPNIRNSQGGETIFIPSFLEVSIAEGELLPGETLSDIKEGGPSGVIDTITQAPGFWTNDDGKLSSTKVLQDNFFYQDFSYVLRTQISIGLFEDIIKKINHPAGFLLFGEFVANQETLLEVNLSTFDSNFGLRSLEELLGIEITIADDLAVLTSQFNSTFFDTTYRKIDENKEDHPWDILFDTNSQFDNVDLSPFEDTPDEPSYLVPDSTLIINS